MAWISVKRQSHLESSERAIPENTATKVFQAISDAPVIDSIDAETASDGTTTIPVVNELYKVGDTRRAKKISPKADPESGLRVWNIEVSYSNKGVSADPNPLDRDPEISWDFSDFTETYFEDRTPEDDDGPLLVLNTAAQMFEEFLERDTGRIRCTISRNIAATAYDPAVAVAYKDVVNDDSFSLDGVTIGVGECKMKSYTAGPRQTENGVAFRVARWDLEFKETWDDEVESRGYQELASGTPLNWVDILGKDGKRIDSPWPLGEDGFALDNADDEPALITFKPYFEDTFASWATVWA